MSGGSRTPPDQFRGRRSPEGDAMRRRSGSHDSGKSLHHLVNLKFKIRRNFFFLINCKLVGYKEKRAPAEENVEHVNNSPPQNNERVQTDEREIDNPERQETQAQDEGKE